MLDVATNNKFNYRPYEFVVLPELPGEIIMGADFLATYGAVIDLPQKRIDFRNREYFYKEDPRYLDHSCDRRIFASSTTVIQPNTCARVPVQVARSGTNNLNGVYCIAASQTFRENTQLSVANCVIDVVDGHGELWISNVSDRRATIPQCMTIARGSQHDAAPPLFSLQSTAATGATRAPVNNSTTWRRCRWRQPVRRRTAR